jgi:hypothetical protein
MTRGYIRPMQLIPSCFFIFIFCLLPEVVTLAQPGGGGGAQFVKFVVDGHALKRDEVMEQIQVYELVSFSSREVKKSYPCNGHIPPPELVFTERAWDQLQVDHLKQNTQWVWTVNGASMIIDFLDVLGENGAGHVEYFDSLEFQPGYYAFSLGKGHGIAEDSRKEIKMHG